MRTHIMDNNTFQLIETMLYDGKIEHLALHLSRLNASAGFFKFNYDEKAIAAELNNVLLKLDKNRYKVRFLMDKDGKIEISTAPVETYDDKYTLAISGARTESANIFLYHKTTIRELYQNELGKARSAGFFDMIFFNEKNELTEGAITNIYLEKDGMLYTPPQSSGLLDGTIRRNLLNTGKAAEKILYINDLIDSGRIFISNSIIGLKEAAVTL